MHHYLFWLIHLFSNNNSSAQVFVYKISDLLNNIIEKELYIFFNQLEYQDKLLLSSMHIRQNLIFWNIKKELNWYLRAVYSIKILKGIYQDISLHAHMQTHSHKHTQMHTHQDVQNQDQSPVCSLCNMPNSYNV